MPQIGTSVCVHLRHGVTATARRLGNDCTTVAIEADDCYGGVTLFFQEAQWRCAQEIADAINRHFGDRAKNGIPDDARGMDCRGANEADAASAQMSEEELLQALDGMPEDESPSRLGAS